MSKIQFCAGLFLNSNLHVLPPPAPIPVTVELDSDAVAAHLLAMSVGGSEVTDTGMCSEFTYRVKMLTQTGNQPLMTVCINYI